MTARGGALKRKHSEVEPNGDTEYAPTVTVLLALLPMLVSYPPDHPMHIPGLRASLKALRRNWWRRDLLSHHVTLGPILATPTTMTARGGALKRKHKSSQMATRICSNCHGPCSADACLVSSRSPMHIPGLRASLKASGGVLDLATTGTWKSTSVAQENA
ncbi:hypothetical protein RhiLY_08454 [Ceratobasidium sp. AG-Ba]|nr:hypothetical protein RhiLY_08454 [Ceratobasidium sp. AG-Ba]